MKNVSQDAPCVNANSAQSSCQNVIVAWASSAHEKTEDCPPPERYPDFAAFAQTVASRLATTVARKARSASDDDINEAKKSLPAFAIGPARSGKSPDPVYRAVVFDIDDFEPGQSLADTRKWITDSHASCFLYESPGSRLKDGPERARLVVELVEPTDAAGYKRAQHVLQLLIPGAAAASKGAGRLNFVGRLDGSPARFFEFYPGTPQPVPPPASGDKKPSAQEQLDLNAVPSHRAIAWASATLRLFCAELGAMAPNSGRNNKLNACALRMFRMALGGSISEEAVRDGLTRAALQAKLPASDVRATLDSAYRGALKEGAVYYSGQVCTDLALPRSDDGTAPFGPLYFAERFISEFGEDCRFVKGLDWVVWSPDVGLWAVDAETAVISFSKQLLRRAVLMAKKELTKLRTEYEALCAFLPAAQQADKRRKQEHPKPAKEELSPASREIFDRLETESKQASDHSAHIRQCELRRREVARDVAHYTDARKKAEAQQTPAGFTAIMTMVEADPRINSMQASDFDVDPYILNCKNGTIDLRTGVLRQHRREDYCTRISPVAYDPKADMTRWLAFLQSASQGSQEKADYLQLVAGYSLTGETTQEQCYFLAGLPGSGKGTFIDAIRYAMGTYAATTSFDTWLHRDRPETLRPDLASLVGVRCVSCSEVDSGSRMSTAVISNATGGDKISACFKFKDTFEFLPKFKLWFLANMPPRVDDRLDASGFWRRVRTIRFDLRVSEAERDTHLKSDLRDPAVGGPGVLRWAVEGARKYIALGKIRTPAFIELANEKYRTDNDPLREFLISCVEFDPAKRVVLDPLEPEQFAASEPDTKQYYVTRADLQDAYDLWIAQEGGERFRLNMREILERLRSQPYSCTDGREPSGDRKRTVVGLRLQPGMAGHVRDRQVVRKARVEAAALRVN